MNINRIKTIALTMWLEMIRKKDIYILFILMGALLSILVSLNIFGLGGVTSYIKDLGLIMVWLFGWILAINISSRELPQEEARRTIFPLLAKPITRMELIIGKWLGSWSIVSVATLIFYILVATVLFIKKGNLEPVTIIQGYFLNIMVLSVIVAIGIAFSTRMNHDASATITYVLTGTSFILIPRIPELLTYETGASGTMLMLLYNLMPHFEVFDMRKRIVHNYGQVEWSVFICVVIYGVLLTFLFLSVAWLAYHKKRFSRSDLSE